MISQILAWSALLALAACGGDQSEEVPLDVPRGYYAQLDVMHAGQKLTFGPFVGYYFKPLHADDLTRLAFVCFNEQRFYTDELAANALLFEGEARLVTLPAVRPLPEPSQRINPVFFEQAPAAWLETRPEPQTEFVHFHSAYHHGGAVYIGYWLRHQPVARFTYNMGGRVGQNSPLFHRAEPDAGQRFPRIIEFDFGPDLFSQ